MNQSADRHRETGHRLPLQPLLDLLPIDRSLDRPDVVGPGIAEQAARILNISTRSVHRLRNTGMSPWTADRLALAAGYHPFAVWGDRWLEAAASEAAREAREPRSAVYKVVSLSL